MLTAKDAPEGYTRKGMAKGWMRRKPNPSIQKLKKENKELKDTLAAVLERLDKLEDNSE